MTTHSKTFQRLELTPETEKQSTPQRTAQIQSAIEEMAASGGGTVAIGAGLWVVSTVILRSGIRLYLEQGAVLQAETDLSLYPHLTNNVNNKDQSEFHLIYADGCEDIAILGEGTIDGQDTAFWKPAQSESERLYGIFDYLVAGDRISPLIQLLHCRRVRVENVTIQRSPGWTLQAFDCEEVHFQGIRIRNNLMGPNADGITINGCRNAFVHRCDVITGDDAIGVKSTNADIEARGVVVSDCIAETNCGAFILGAETLGGIYDVTFTNCVARASLRLIAVEMWDAGHVENIVFSNIVGRTFPQPRVTCERPIYLDIQQWFRTPAPGEEPLLGQMRNVIFSNIVCTTRGRIVMTAQDGAWLENIVLRDVHLEIPEIEDPAVEVPAARSMQNSNFNPHTRAARAAVVADNVKGLQLAGVSVHWPATSSVPMHAICTRNVEDVDITSPRLRSNRADVEREIQLEKA